MVDTSGLVSTGQSTRVTWCPQICSALCAWQNSISYDSFDLMLFAKNAPQIIQYFYLINSPDKNAQGAAGKHKRQKDCCVSHMLGAATKGNRVHDHIGSSYDQDDDEKCRGYLEGFVHG